MYKIMRRQFTRRDSENFPQFDNSSYLEYERIKTGISKETVSFGYIKTNGAKYKWIPIKEAKNEK